MVILEAALGNLGAALGAGIAVLGAGLGIGRIGGTAMEFASGYEGAGKSGGSGFYTFYRVNATSTRLDAPAGNMMAQSQVGTIYRYVPK